MKKLKPRKIVVGCDERSQTVTVTDQRMLRTIHEITSISKAFNKHLLAVVKASEQNKIHKGRA